MVSFLNHIASILYERGPKCGAVYYPLFNCNVHQIILDVAYKRHTWMEAVYGTNMLGKSFSGKQ